MKKLFERTSIGNMQLKNRAVMAPMGVFLCDENGYPGERMIKYYEDRARGGTGLITIEASNIERTHSAAGISSVYISEDKAIPPLEKLTEAIHRHDAKVFIQLYHSGATANPAFIQAEAPWGPSDVPAGPGRPVPTPMTKEDIKYVQDCFVNAAVRCITAGFDGVELHGAHGYLLAEFWSPHYNKRTDEYGGSFENRMRFLDEIIDRIKAALPPDAIVGARMCGDEMSPMYDDMMDLEYGLKVAKHLEEKGLDYISISNGSAINPNANCEPYSYTPGWKKHVAKAYKEALNIPVIATNTIKSPEFAEQMLEEGVCDLVALGRSQFADPEFMKKAQEGRADEIRQCIGCMYCRERVLWKGLPVDCTVNPRIGKEEDYDRVPPQNGNGRPVAVIGGGCGGMEAAKVLADRGFKVTLYEKDDHLGGRLNLADKPRHKEIITHLTETMILEIEKRGVEVKLGVEATPEMVKADIDPVGVFVCTGSDWIVPPIPGCDKDIVCTPEDLLLGKVKAGKKAVVAGSGNTGIECVEKLQDDGSEVTMIDMLDEVGKGMYPIILSDLMSRVTPNEPEIMLKTMLKAVEDDGVIVEDMETGEEKKIEADLVCLSLGSKPNSKLIDSFMDAFDKVIVIGSAVKDGRIHDATKQGYMKGYMFE